jgi:DNA repair exonuclease SbcCD ATPase subunit
LKIVLKKGKIRMKIINLSIENFRGIVKFNAAVENKSFVITGPNGTGKSGIIDAIDFLLTGDLQRLRGEGTKAITLDEHGRHIDKDIKTVAVSAEIEEDSEIFEIKRKLHDKKLVLIKGNKAKYEALREKIEAGQFLLSRREILKFIACTGQQRSEGIQALLDTSGIEKVRAALQSILTAQEKLVLTHNSTIASNLTTTNTLLGITTNSPSELRRTKINELRQVLGKEVILHWNADTDIIAGISIVGTEEIKFKKSSFEKLVNQVREEMVPMPIDTDKVFLKEKISSALDKIAKINNFHKLIAGNILITNGLQLLDGETCPLCDTDWTGKNLENHLKQKKNLANEAVLIKTEYERLITQYNLQLQSFIANLRLLIPTIEGTKNDNLLELTKNNISTIEERIEATKNIEELRAIKNQFQKEKLLIDIPDYEQFLQHLTRFKDALPEESKEEAAQKILHQISGLFKTVKDASIKLGNDSKKLALYKALNKKFTTCRENFFSNLYLDVENDFVTYYKFLNQDEENFIAKIIDKEKVVDLQVDFYQRGLHPPHALHSEGHQDSMGICLFLSLMKKLKGNYFSIALLDDVMMSIDSSHRRRLCKLLKNQFSNTQFVITTHDPIWARQLKQFGVVPKKGVFHFYNWSLESGPVYETKEVWEILREKAKNGQIHDAASGMRRNLELEFQEICTNLSAQVTFKATHSWDLGELKEASISTFKIYISKAKIIANKRNQREAISALQIIEEKLNEAIKISCVDQWQINPTIHYNQWENFSKEEIIATINAFEKLIQAFTSDGTSKYQLTFPSEGYSPVGFTTAAGGINFTLVNPNGD